VDKTDYQPGDAPVPVGTWVFYQGSRTPGVYRVVSHMNPALYPDFGARFSRSEIYPDGAAYELWPVGVPVKPDNGYLGVLWARRTSFRINIAQELNREV